MNVGENIRRIRTARGMSQNRLAEDAGITQSMLNQVERGTKNPSLQVGAELARLLGVPLEQLLTGEATPDGRDEWEGM